MYTVGLELLLKGDFPKFLEELLLEHSIRVLDFSTELRTKKVSVILLKSDSTTDALPAILKILGKTKGTLELESVIGVVIGGWTGQLKFLKKELY